MKEKLGASSFLPICHCPYLSCLPLLPKGSQDSWSHKHFHSFLQLLIRTEPSFFSKSKMEELGLNETMFNFMIYSLQLQPTYPPASGEEH